MRCIPLVLLGALAAHGQTPSQFNHVQWTLSSEQSAVRPGGTVLAKLVATIDPGWHMYSPTTPPGPIPTTFRVVESPAVEQMLIFQSQPERKFDPNFNASTETYEGTATFYARIRLKKDVPAGRMGVSVEPRYQTCSGTSCIPPRTRLISASFEVDPAAAAAESPVPAGFAEAVRPAAPAEVPGAPSDTGLLSFLGIAFGFGLAAVFTPCVFPMIPITMSYFVGQKGGFAQAVTFCLGIVVLFTGLGLLATLTLGPSGVNHLGASVWVNAFISLVFLVFGMSLLGAFEIVIPSGILTKLNAASNQGGLVGSLLMGLTFALASFACVGPFMGTLLAASVTGGTLRPVVGMAAFSGGLSAPFFLLALFPAWLKRLPRSGEWLARVKVVMGFVVLAAMLKYLHNVDDVLRTGFLTRERFLAGWVVLAAMVGLYLLGFVRLPGISGDAELGAGRLVTGMLAVALSLSLVPGMFNAKLGDIEAFIPPPGSDVVFAGVGGAPSAAVPQMAWLENDLDGAFARAKAENRKVLVDFTGDACTNCKWMKANLFTRPEIAGPMRDLVLVELYTDRSDPVSESYQKLEAEKFHTVAIPFYVLYDQDRNVLATFADRTEESSKYLAFLNSAPSAAPAPSAAGPAAAGPAAAGPVALEGGPFRTVDGAPLNTAAWKGKVVVLNYWATWCIPCRQEIPEFNRMSRDLAPQGVEVVGINMDEEGAEAVRPFLKQIPMNYTVGLGSGTLAQLPVTLIIDPSGRTVKRFDGFAKPEEIRAAVAKART